ncbi:MAG: T9SS type A sorting domain-containing protein [Calditrichaeota bacterium]|nr:T9SS type A sorting domain-containing protein [Calditrichota bacterium]
MAKNEGQEMVLAVVRDDSTVIHEDLLFWACDSVGMPRGNPLAMTLPDSQSATGIMMASIGHSFYAAYSYGNLTLPDAPLRIWLTAFTAEDIVHANSTEIMPQNFQISAWPNPFNSSVNIAYFLPASGPVTLSVYDLLGRRVEMLVQGNQVFGAHQIEWRAESQASGTYFVRMQSRKNSATQKVILLK